VPLAIKKVWEVESIHSIEYTIILETASLAFGWERIKLPHESGKPPTEMG